MWYSILYSLGFSCVFVCAPFSKKVRRGLWERIGLVKRVRAYRQRMARGPIWFHVASSGELEQCLPIMDEAKGPIFLSFFSPSAKDAIRCEENRRHEANLKVPWGGADYLPFDWNFTVAPFLGALKPACLVIIRREVWLGVLTACRKERISCYLVASYFSPQSKKWLWLYRRGLSLFDEIGTVCEDTTRTIRSLGLNNVSTLGDPRIERVYFRKRIYSPRKESKWLNSRPLFLLGSIWREDFDAISSALAKFLVEFPIYRLLIAPHEPREPFIRTIQKWGKTHSFSLQLVSKWTDSDASHILLDRVGELAELYQFSRIAFVGGSFHSRVHNVLEPAVYGNPIFTGPFIENSPEAVEMAYRGDLVSIKNGEALFLELSKIVKDESLWEKRSRGTLAYLASQLGASSRYLNLIKVPGIS